MFAERQKEGDRSIEVKSEALGVCSYVAARQ